jgi:hypothetical protein
VLSCADEHHNSYELPPSLPNQPYHLAHPAIISFAMTSKYLIPVLVTMMLVTGVCNTLLTKYQVRRLAIPMSSLLITLLSG